MQSLQRILALVIKEFVTILKDPKSRFVIIGPPIIQFFVFGYAATYDLENVRYAVFDESRTPDGLTQSQLCIGRTVCAQCGRNPADEKRRCVL